MEESRRIEEICRLTKASTLQQICDLTYEIMGNPAFICDMTHTVLAYTKCVEVSDPMWNFNIVQGALERNTLVQDRDVSIVHGSSSGGQKAVLVKDSYQEYPRFIKTLVIRGSAAGVLVVTAYFRPFEDCDQDLMDLIASFLTPILEKERFSLKSGGKSVESLFRKLLDGAEYTREQVENRLHILNYPFRAHTYLLCIGERHWIDPDRPGSLDAILDRFYQIPGCYTLLYNTTLVCIYGSDEEVENWREQVPALTQILESEGLLAGVSRSIVSLHLLKEYYVQARDVLEVGLKLVREHTLYVKYDSYSSFLLLQHVPEEELMNYCHQKIQILQQYDDAHNTELGVTLQIYLEQAKSLVKTADILYIHRNTVRYRIRKCMEIMGTDLEDGNEIFAFILSLRILEYRRKLAPGAALYPGLTRSGEAGEQGEDAGI